MHCKRKKQFLIFYKVQIEQYIHGICTSISKMKFFALRHEFSRPNINQNKQKSSLSRETYTYV